MSRPYRPANGTEGASFIDFFCCRCHHDRNEDCPILAASFAYDIDHPQYPKEWVQEDDGDEARCTAFVPADSQKAGRLPFPDDEKVQLKLFESAPRG